MRAYIFLVLMSAIVQIQSIRAFSVAPRSRIRVTSVLPIGAQRAIFLKNAKDDNDPDATVSPFQPFENTMRIVSAAPSYLGPVVSRSSVYHLARVHDTVFTRTPLIKIVLPIFYIKKIRQD